MYDAYYEGKIQAGVWKNKRYAEQWIREMRNYIYPAISFMPIREIKAGHVKEAEQNRIPRTAADLYDRINAVFLYSKSLELCDHNPCRAAKKEIKPEEEAHFPAIPWEDVPRFVKEVIFEKSKGEARWALLFLILNAARSGAVRNLEFSEIEFDKKIWTMPANAPERKISVKHFYLLDRQSIEMLLQQKEK